MTDTSLSPIHATLVFERTCIASIESVFAAFADAVARARWSAPGGDVLIYDASDFTIGGRDLFRCGPKDDPRFHGETRYHDIVANGRIVSTESIDADGKRLSVSLTTIEFARDGAATKVRSTVQLVSLVGPGMIEGTKSGTNAALDNLVRALHGGG